MQTRQTVVSVPSKVSAFSLKMHQNLWDCKICPGSGLWLLILCHGARLAFIPVSNCLNLWSRLFYLLNFSINLLHSTCFLFYILAWATETKSGRARFVNPAVYSFSLISILFSFLEYIFSTHLHPKDSHVLSWVYDQLNVMMTFCSSLLPILLVQKDCISHLLMFWDNVAFLDIAPLIVNAWVKRFIMPHIPLVHVFTYSSVYSSVCACFLSCWWLIAFQQG